MSSTSQDRLALLFCTPEEGDAVRAQLGSSQAIVLDCYDEAAIGQTSFDFAIIGAAAASRRAVTMAVLEKLHVPAMLLLSSPTDEVPFDDYPALSMSELHRLPFMIRRELRLHRTEQALRVSEGRYRQLIDQAQEGVWVLDTAGRTTFVNHKMAEMLGCTAQSIAGRPIFDFIDEGMRALAVHNLHAPQADYPEAHDFRMQRGDGSGFWALLTTTPLFDELGRYVGALALVSDITLRKQMEAMLRRRETQLSMAQELAGVGSWEWDLATSRMTASPELTRLLTVESSGPVDIETVTSIIHPEDQQALCAVVTQAIAEGSLFEHEFRVVVRKSVARHVHARAQVITDESGTPVRLIGILQDITARKESEQALGESEERYRNLVDQATDIIYSVDPEGRITSLNPAFETVTGWNPVDWLGRHFSDLLDPSTMSAAHDPDGSAGGASHTMGEYQMLHRGGGYLTFETTMQPLMVGERVVGSLGIARDVTRRKALEAEQEREKRLASLGQLAASVAHEFNNVLMSILPFAELLRRRVPGDERVEVATKHIMQAIRRGRQISQEVLRFSRPANATLAAVDVHEWLAVFLREASSLLGTKYRLNAYTHVRGPLFIEADRALLEQVATNLIINARDAMPAGGSIAVEIHRSAGDRGQVELSVRDNGPGIAPDILERIFDPLFTTKPAGNGLGLTIAYQAMTLQRGTLRVTSIVGAGSTFSMLFREAPAPERDHSELVRGAEERRRVVLVEDDEAVGEGIRSLLVDEGFDVKLVIRGLEAAGAIETFTPDLVVLDVNLPDINGIDLYERLNGRWPLLPVIFSTGHADASALEDVRRRQVPSIMKPYEISDLLDVMEKSLVTARDRRLLTDASHSAIAPAGAR